MSLNSSGSYDAPEKSQTPINVTVEANTFTTPEWCLQEIKELITLIKKKYESREIWNIMITVNTTAISINSWVSIGMISNEYNIPKLVMHIYDALSESERKNFRQAFLDIQKTDIGTDPTESEEELLRWIKFYLDRKLR